MISFVFVFPSVSPVVEPPHLCSIPSATTTSLLNVVNALCVAVCVVDADEPIVIGALRVVVDEINTGAVLEPPVFMRIDPLLADCIPSVSGPLVCVSPIFI